MKKFDANIIIKNLTGILCGAMILCFLLPFVSAEAKMSVAGASGSAAESVNGFSLLTEGGFLGIMLFLCPILILIANYLPQLGQYKKIISLILSVASIIILFLSPAQLSAQGGNQSFSVDVKTTYQIGFWLMLVCSVAIALLSAIQFFNLNGNKIFEAVNTSDETPNDGNHIKTPQINLDKLTDFAKNTASVASQQIKNVTDNVVKNYAESNTIHQKNSVQTENTATDSSETSAPKSNISLTAKRSVTADSPVQKENPEVIMDLIKKMYDMNQSGILTDEEFTAKKQEMLEKM